MKVFLTILTLFIILNNSYAKDHLVANNCEVFVDKVLGFNYYSNPGDSLHPIPFSINFYIKTINNRFDSEIEEVGALIKERFRRVSFHNRMSGNYSLHYDDEGEWRHFRAMPFEQSSNYWVASFSVHRRFEQVHALTKFYVRTVNGTYYWIGEPSINFDLNDHLENFLAQNNHVATFTAGLETAANTQTVPLFKQLNPNRCF